MERLTEVAIEDGVKLYDISEKLCLSKTTQGEKIAAILKKLADYEDLEEQGRLLKLPYKVGDTVWNYSYFGLKKYKVKYIGFDKNGLLYFDCDNGITYGFRCYLKDSKDKIFLTKSEAEAKLKELRGAE